ncbi:MAG TPA: hypothetical protein VJ142_02765 [Candidatus Nanoarchaeia archaeon]|nr:hypothetical protein [Candidatus Nanoarchaeia archaeon]
MIERGDKKGLSTVVTNLLLILLVLVAVGVVWVVVRGILSEGAGEIEISQFTFDLQIQSAYVSGTDVVVGVKRNAGGGELSGMKFVFSTGTESVTIDKIGAINELDRKTFTFTSAEIPGIGMGDEVSVAPIYESGGQKTGSVTDSATISGNPPAGSGGTGNPGTGTCGDTLIQDPNSDGINEQCDGNNLGGQTCIGLGFVGGTPSCDSGCQLDTSQCTGAAPASCNGAWEGASEDLGVECDGTPLPNGCAADCTCEQGYTSDLSGGCNLNPPLDTGIIFSVWHNLYFDSNNLPKSDAVTNYINNYVNFSGSAETGCFLITFADYIVEDDMSYLRVDNSLGIPNIAAGQGYSVWEAANCGQ